MSDWDALAKAAGDPQKYFAHVGEMMLAKKREGQRWQVTFDLPMEEEHHPFNRFHGKATGKAGTRFMCILVEIDDEDNPVDQKRKTDIRSRRQEVPMGKKLVKESGMLRRDIKFTRFLYWKWQHMDIGAQLLLEEDMPHGLLQKIHDTGGKYLGNEKAAKRFNDHMVHYLCDVVSCRELAYNKTAADKFNALASEFVKWAHGRANAQS
jgi:hypothetical protein